MCNIETVAVASSGYNSRSRGKPYLVSCPCSLACEYKEQQLLVEVKQPHFVISFSSLLSSSPPVCECVCAHTLFQPLPTWVTYFLFLPEPSKKFAKKLTHAIIRIHTRLIEAKVQIHHSLVLNKVNLIGKYS
jgi:hypothetical protein